MCESHLRQLKICEAAGRHLSFTRASAELHLPQPAVSTQLKQLEEVVVLPSFERGGKRIWPNKAGFGPGLLSLHAAEMELALKRLPILRKWQVLRRAGKRLSSAVQSFKRFAPEESDDILTLATLERGQAVFPAWKAPDNRTSAQARQGVRRPASCSFCTREHPPGNNHSGGADQAGQTAIVSRHKCAAKKSPALRAFAVRVFCGERGATCQLRRCSALRISSAMAIAESRSPARQL